MRHRLAFLLASLAIFVLAACGDDVADPNDVALVKVSGDGQTAPVLLSGAAPRSLGTYSVAAAAQNEYLPELLVARLDVQSGGALLAPTGVAAVTVPAGTEVDWRVADAGGGGPLNSTTLPDDTGYVDNKWRRPTKAGTYDMLAEYITGDSVVSEVAYTATFEPGPAVESHWVIDDTMRATFNGEPPMLTFVCEAITDCPGHFRDANANPIWWRFESATPWLRDTLIARRGREGVEGDTLGVPGLVYDSAAVGDSAAVRVVRDHIPSDTATLADMVVFVIENGAPPYLGLVVRALYPGGS